MVRCRQGVPERVVGHYTGQQQVELSWSTLENKLSAGRRPRRWAPVAFRPLTRPGCKIAEHPAVPLHQNPAPLMAIQTTTEGTNDGLDRR